ncbi:MAG: hypothetical protein DI629_21285, partial [Mesorhizobium amorphae]
MTDIPSVTKTSVVNDPRAFMKAIQRSGEGLITSASGNVRARVHRRGSGAPTVRVAVMKIDFEALMSYLALAPGGV